MENKENKIENLNSPNKTSDNQKDYAENTNELKSEKDGVNFDQNERSTNKGNQ